MVFCSCLAPFDGTRHGARQSAKATEQLDAQGGASQECQAVRGYNCSAGKSSRVPTPDAAFVLGEKDDPSTPSSSRTPLGSWISHRYRLFKCHLWKGGSAKAARPHASSPPPLVLPQPATAGSLATDDPTQEQHDSPACVTSAAALPTERRSNPGANPDAGLLQCKGPDNDHLAQCTVPEGQTPWGPNEAEDNNLGGVPVEHDTREAPGLHSYCPREVPGPTSSSCPGFVPAPPGGDLQVRPRLPTVYPYDRPPSNSNLSLSARRQLARRLQECAAQQGLSRAAPSPSVTSQFSRHTLHANSTLVEGPSYHEPNGQQADVPKTPRDLPQDGLRPGPSYRQPGGNPAEVEGGSLMVRITSGTGSPRTTNRSLLARQRTPYALRRLLGAAFSGCGASDLGGGAGADADPRFSSPGMGTGAPNMYASGFGSGRARELPPREVSQTIALARPITEPRLNCVGEELEAPSAFDFVDRLSPAGPSGVATRDGRHPRFVDANGDSIGLVSPLTTATALLMRQQTPYPLQYGGRSWWPDSGDGCSDYMAGRGMTTSMEPLTDAFRRLVDVGRTTTPQMTDPGDAGVTGSAEPLLTNPSRARPWSRGSSMRGRISGPGFTPPNHPHVRALRVQHSLTKSRRPSVSSLASLCNDNDSGSLPIVIHTSNCGYGVGSANTPTRRGRRRNLAGNENLGWDLSMLPRPPLPPTEHAPAPGPFATPGALFDASIYQAPPGPEAFNPAGLAAGQAPFFTQAGTTMASSPPAVNDLATGPSGGMTSRNLYEMKVGGFSSSMATHAMSNRHEVAKDGRFLHAVGLDSPRMRYAMAPHKQSPLSQMPVYSPLRAVWSPSSSVASPRSLDGEDAGFARTTSPLPSPTLRPGGTPKPLRLRCPVGSSATAGGVGSFGDLAVSEAFAALDPRQNSTQRITSSKKLALQPSLPAAHRNLGWRLGVRATQSSDGRGALLLPFAGPKPFTQPTPHHGTGYRRSCLSTSRPTSTNNMGLMGTATSYGVVGGGVCVGMGCGQAMSVGVAGREGRRMLQHTGSVRSHAPTEDDSAESLAKVAGSDAGCGTGKVAELMEFLDTFSPGLTPHHPEALGSGALFGVELQPEDLAEDEPCGDGGALLTSPQEGMLDRAPSPVLRGLPYSGTEGQRLGAVAAGPGGCGTLRQPLLAELAKAGVLASGAASSRLSRCT